MRPSQGDELLLQRSCQEPKAAGLGARMVLGGESRNPYSKENRGARSWGDKKPQCSHHEPTFRGRKEIRSLPGAERNTRVTRAAFC